MGLIELLEAWSKIDAHAASHMRLMIAGQGPLLPELQRRIAELGLSEQVTMLGYLSDQNLAAFYQACDLTVVPSRQLEGFGLVVLESLAAGTPVLASDVGGLAETLEAFSPELVVKGASADEWTQRLADAAAGRLTLPTGEAARAFARTFSWSRAADEHVRRVYVLDPP